MRKPDSTSSLIRVIKAVGGATIILLSLSLSFVQVLDLLTEQEVKMVVPTYAITPRTFVLKPGMTLFVGGIARIDFLQVNLHIAESLFYTIIIKLINYILFDFFFLECRLFVDCFMNCCLCCRVKSLAGFQLWLQILSQFTSPGWKKLIVFMKNMLDMCCLG